MTNISDALGSRLGMRRLDPSVYLMTRNFFIQNLQFLLSLLRQEGCPEYPIYQAFMDEIIILRIEPLVPFRRVLS